MFLLRKYSNKSPMGLKIYLKTQKSSKFSKNLIFTRKCRTNFILRDILFSDFLPRKFGIIKELKQIKVLDSAKSLISRTNSFR